MTAFDANKGGLRATSPLNLCHVSDGERPGRASAHAAEEQISISVPRPEAGYQATHVAFRGEVPLIALARIESGDGKLFSRPTTGPIQLLRSRCAQARHAGKVRRAHGSQDRQPGRGAP